MKPAANIATCVVVAALLAAPAAWACCGPATAGSPCAMDAAAHGRMTAPAAPMTGSAPCHGGDRFTSECCEVGAAPEPVLARFFEIERLLAAVEVGEPLETPPPGPVCPAARSAPPGSSRLHDLGRYTLFSALLL